MARQTVVSDAELGAVESSVIRYYVLIPVGVPFTAHALAENLADTMQGICGSEL